MRIAESELKARKKRKFYGRLISGLTRQIEYYGCKLRRTKYSPLLQGRCLMFITLTSSNESQGSISDAWNIMLRRIKRRYPSFEYLKLRTQEGVSGVLHIVARANSFIPKDWLTENWGDTFQAPVTWTTQAYGDMRSLIRYLIGYLGHHTVFRYGYSKKWIFPNSATLMHDLFRSKPYKTALSYWKVMLWTRDHNVKKKTEVSLDAYQQNCGSCKEPHKI